MTPDAPEPEFTPAEVRDWFCCPCIWWFKRRGPGLEKLHRLQRLTDDPEAGRPRKLAFEVPRLGLAGTLMVAGTVTALLTWLIMGLTRHVKDVREVARLTGSIGSCVMWLSGTAVFLVNRWRRRTPGYSKLMPGEPVYCDSRDGSSPELHAPSCGLCGRPGHVGRFGRNLFTVETRHVEAPKRLADADRLQAVATAMLAADAFGIVPDRGYVMYPDHTFEVEVLPGRTHRVREALRLMRKAVKEDAVPDAAPASHLCPDCPLADCPRRAGAPASPVS